MTRTEHMRWAKGRALEYVKQNDLQNAVASMMSDLNKHSETRDLGGSMGMVGMMEVQRGPDAVRRWIEGFAE